MSERNCEEAEVRFPFPLLSSHTLTHTTQKYDDDYDTLTYTTQKDDDG